MPNQPYIQPINPIGFPGGAVMPIQGGRAIWRLDPLPDGAPDADMEHFNLFTATMAALGHRVIVSGDDSVFATALIEELGL